VHDLHAPAESHLKAAAPSDFKSSTCLKAFTQAGTLIQSIPAKKPDVVSSVDTSRRHVPLGTAALNVTAGVAIRISTGQRLLGLLLMILGMVRQHVL